MKTIMSLLVLVLLSFNPTPETTADNHKIFLSNPTNYSFKCGCDIGEVSSASLRGDKLLVTYSYPCMGKIRKGLLEGTYDKTTNKFKGIYNTENKSFYGEMNFSFNDKGEATGTWGNGTGRVMMKLKNRTK